MAGVGKTRKIVESGSASSEDRVEFGVEFLFDARILREEQPGPGKSAGSGFVSREEQREGFVAELLGGHAGAVFILRVNEQREKIAGIFAGSTALLDDAIDDASEITDRAFGSEIEGRGEPRGSHQEAAKVHGELEKSLEIFADFGSVALDVSVEERFADNAKSETHHGVVNVELLAVAPGAHELRGTIGHGGGVVGNAVAMKGRLHHAALAKPEFAFAGEQAIAEEETIGAQNAALNEFAGAVDDDVFDVVGVEEEVGAKVEEAQADDVAVIAGGVGHEG